MALIADTMLLKLLTALFMMLARLVDETVVALASAMVAMAFSMETVFSQEHWLTTELEAEVRLAWAVATVLETVLMEEVMVLLRLVVRTAL